MDLDWEYPAGRGNSPLGDKQKYTQLVQKLAYAFYDDAFKNRFKDRLLLTAAVPAGKQKVEAGYEVDKLAVIFDWINLMSYDLHGNWEDKTGHHTAMASSGTFVRVKTIIYNEFYYGFYFFLTHIFRQLAVDDQFLLFCSLEVNILIPKLFSCFYYTLLSNKR